MAHAGMLAMLAGIAASTFDAVDTEPVAVGETISMAGVEVSNDGVVVGPGPRVATEAVTARVRVDGDEGEIEIEAGNDVGDVTMIATLVVVDGEGKVDDRREVED